MNRLEFSFQTTVEFSKPVKDHAFVLRCLPPTNSVQSAHAHLELEPDVPFDIQTDSFGNIVAVGSVEKEHSLFTYHSSGIVTVDRTHCAYTKAHPMFTYDTPRTAITEEMREFLADSVSKSMRDAVLARHANMDDHTFTCVSLMHAVHDYLEYKPGSTTTQTTAAQAFTQRAGVCQDYAHILIGLLRNCGIPARYMSGLTVGEGATHAWVEAHIDGKWIGLDPTRNRRVDESYISLACGRDWADCPIERGTMQGFSDQTQTVFAQVEIAD